VAGKITYYAVIAPRSPRDDPSGLVRRREDEEGFEDEALWKDLKWHFSPTIVEWKRGDSSSELVEIDEEEANRLIEKFRERWRSL
jgi:hypothetical protein